jgi:hypothetical protein
MQPLHLAEISFALALTLAIKIAVAPSLLATQAPGADAAPIATFLKSQGFAVGAAITNTDPPMLPAHRDDCNLRIAEISPLGWHRHVLAQLARSDERAFFVFQGELSEDQPIWRTFIDHSWRRLLAYAGLESPRRPVLGVLAPPACSLHELPWDKLAELS